MSTGGELPKPSRETKKVLWREKGKKQSEEKLTERLAKTSPPEHGKRQRERAGVGGAVAQRIDDGYTKGIYTPMYHS